MRALYLQGGSGYSNEVAVTLHAARPAAPPVNLQPASCAALPPHFRWDAAPSATGYYLRARAAASNQMLLDNSSIVGNTYVPATPGELSRLEAHVGQDVAWSVKACNNMGCSDWAADVTIVLRRPVRADFDGDCRSDLLLRQRTSGDLRAWLLDGATRTGEALLSPARPSAGNWTLAGTADFDDDGRADLLWWNADSGNLAIWFMDGATRISGVAAQGQSDLRWRVAATGDFDGDRRADILWRRSDTGELAAAFLSPVWVPRTVPLDPSAMTADWTVAAVGDLTGDRKSDLLWRHSASGELRYWAMDGVRRVGQGPVSSSSVPDLGWRVVGVWNVDQDGQPDVVWQNHSSSALVVWYMSGATHTGGEYFTPAQSGADFEGVGPR